MDSTRGAAAGAPKVAGRVSAGPSRDERTPAHGPAGTVPAEVRHEPGDDRPQPARAPLYPRLLRLQHVHPNAWQRALLGEGMAGLGLLLAMADLASAWSVVVLPVAVAGVVKAHDVLAGLLAESTPEPPA